MKGCQNGRGYGPLKEIPAIRYTKPFANTVAELYERYPDGAEKGSYAFVYEVNTFCFYHTDGEYKGQWVPISGGGYTNPVESQVQSDYGQTDSAAVDYIKRKPALKTVATTGSYNDLSNKPTIPAAPDLSGYAKTEDLAEVARSGQYGDLKNRPVGGIAIVSDVTEMFTTNSTARFSARMTGHNDGKKVIELFGEDTSGSDNDLVITAALGFGADNNKPKNAREFAAEDDAIATDYKIITTAETADGINGTFTVQNGCPEFYFKFFAGLAESSVKKSYWVDVNGIYHNFSALDTPITNFCAIGSTLTINGQTVSKSQIAEIVFGSNYSGTTKIPDYFLYGFRSLLSVYLNVFENVVEIGNSFMSNCSSLKELEFSVFKSLVKIGANCFSGCNNLKGIGVGALPTVTTILDHFAASCLSIEEFHFAYFPNLVSLGQAAFIRSGLRNLNLSSSNSLEFVGMYFFEQCAQLNIIDIGYVDWTNIFVEADSIADNTTNNNSQNILRTSSTALAQSFKTKFPRVSNWSVVVNY